MSTPNILQSTGSSDVAIERKDIVRSDLAPSDRLDAEQLPTVYWTFSGEFVLPIEDDLGLLTEAQSTCA